MRQPRDLEQLLQEQKVEGFDAGFSSRVMDRVAAKRRQDEAIVPLFTRTAIAAAVLMLGLATYNLSTGVGDHDVVERLFGVPSSTTVLEAYSHDIDSSL